LLTAVLNGKGKTTSLSGRKKLADGSSGGRAPLLSGKDLGLTSTGLRKRAQAAELVPKLLGLPLRRKRSIFSRQDGEVQKKGVPWLKREGLTEEEEGGSSLLGLEPGKKHGSESPQKVDILSVLKKYRLEGKKSD